LPHISRRVNLPRFGHSPDGHEAVVVVDEGGVNFNNVVLRQAKMEHKSTRRLPVEDSDSDDGRGVGLRHRKRPEEIEMANLDIEEEHPHGKTAHHRRSHKRSAKVDMKEMEDLIHQLHQRRHHNAGHPLNGTMLEEEEGLKEKAILAVMNHVIEADPTEALRLNILEACIAGIYVFHGSALVDPDMKYPPNTKGGFVLTADAMFGSPKGCDAACMQVFGQGKFTFSNSLMWQHLYSGWNAALMLASTSMGEWWGKLVTPAVVESPDGETYIIRRTIALWLTLFKKAFRFDKEKRTGLCRNSYLLSANLGIQHMMGQEVWRYAEEYTSLWEKPLPTECADCKTNFEGFLESHTKYIRGLNFTSAVAQTVRAVKNTFSDLFAAVVAFVGPSRRMEA